MKIDTGEATDHRMLSLAETAGGTLGAAEDEFSSGFEVPRARWQAAAPTARR